MFKYRLKSSFVKSSQQCFHLGHQWMHNHSHNWLCNDFVIDFCTIPRVKAYHDLEYYKIHLAL